jgi:protein-S-isoprenylcysteine O-methyltransferase Ste14
VPKYAIGLGGNLGDRLANLRNGVNGIRELGSVARTSNLYETAPVGGPEQPPYLNAVLVLDSDLDPHELLQGLHAVGPDLDARSALELLEPQGVEEVSVRWVEDRKPRLGMLFVTIQFVWFLGVALALAWDGTLPEGSGDVFRIGGAAMAFIGGGMAFVSLRRLGDSLTALPEPKADGTLIEHGPYRYARHPIYGGVSLFMIGTALIVNSLVGTLLSLGLVPFFYLKSTYEERQLRITYPGYRAYRERVSRRLIPFII